MRVFIRYVPVTGAQRSVDNICMNQQGSQRRATMRRAVLVWSDERTTGTPVGRGLAEFSPRASLLLSLQVMYVT
jgi:hypothetical protein